VQSARDYPAIVWRSDFVVAPRIGRGPNYRDGAFGRLADAARGGYGLMLRHVRQQQPLQVLGEFDVEGAWVPKNVWKIGLRELQHVEFAGVAAFRVQWPAHGRRCDVYAVESVFPGLCVI